MGIRLDAMGAILTFIVALLTVGTRFTISPAQTGLVLSYILSVQQAYVFFCFEKGNFLNGLVSIPGSDGLSAKVLKWRTT